jgi:class 3 adenylate cyclase
VREVIGRRLSRLSDGCNRMLTVASTMTGGFSWDALKAINAGTPEADLLDLLEEALAAQLITERKGELAGMYDFTHALIRQTLYDELSTPRRVLLHRQIGEALEALYEGNVEPHLAELAHHFYQAAPGGDVQKATDYARRAGDRSVELLAYEEAAGHYERALQVLELHAKADERQRYELLRALGRAYVRSDLPEQALATTERALALAESFGDPRLQAEAAMGYFDAAGRGPLAFSGAGRPALERALAALEGQEGAEAARLLARLSQLAAPKFETRTHEERLALARRAKAIADRSGDLAARLDALRSLYDALSGPAATAERIVLGEERIRVAEQMGDRPAILAARDFRLVDLGELGDMGAVRQEVPAICDLADTMREPWFSAWRPIWSATLATAEGRYAEAEGFVMEYAPIVARTQHPGFQGALASQLYDIRRAQGRLVELEGLLLDFSKQFGVLPLTESALAYLYLEEGRLDEACSAFEHLAAKDFTDVPAETNTLTILALGAELSRRLPDRRRAALLYDILLPYADRQIVTNNAALFIGSASYSLGELAATMGRWDDAERHFEQALAFNERIGVWPWLARTQHEYASMLRERDEPGDTAKSRELVNKAIEAFDKLGMKKDLERALALKLEMQGATASGIYTSIDAVARAVHDERPSLPQQALAPDGTVTIMFSDIEDSTVLTERLGDQAWLELLRQHNAIIRKQLRAYDGFEVKTIGDAFMVAFRSAKKGLDCAIAIQRAFDGDLTPSPSPSSGEGGTERVRVRIGLHAGEAIKDGDDFYGKNVILASRVAGKAAGGEILVSSLVRQLVESSVDAGTFADSREVELKGLGGTHTVHAVRWTQDAARPIESGGVSS